MNRLEQRQGGESAEPLAGDYFLVVGENFTWYVSTEMARFIEACLDCKSRPRWIRFVDLAGSRVRVRARQIEYICQCTSEQRAAERAFFRALKQEPKVDRSWGEDD
jgi:hypothetical protein